MTTGQGTERRDQLGSAFFGPVRVADEIEHIETTILEHCSLPHPALATLLACWIANTFMFKLFRYCGYISLRSDEPQCGKSRVLRLIGIFSKGNPKPMTIPTPAVIFRRAQGVMLLDEVDNLRGQDKQVQGLLLAVLNAGFEEGNTVPRNERKTTKEGKDEWVLEEFDVYGPKAFAGLESLANTLADRTFAIKMQAAETRRPRLKPHKIEPEAAWRRASLGLWAAETESILKQAVNDMPDELPSLMAYDHRFQDIAEPLVTIATIARTKNAPAGR